MKRMASCECEPARSSILCSFKQTMTGVQQTPSRCSERPQNGEGQERCNRNQPGDLRSQFCWPCRCSSICRTREESFDAREQNLRAYVTLLTSENEKSLVSNISDDRPDPERQYLAKELTARAFLGLPPSLIDMFIRNKVGGWSHRELASEIGITMSALKSRMFEARSRMREHLRAVC